MVGRKERDRVTTVEAVIRRNEDGTTSVVYPDSDDEGDIVADLGEGTNVVNGE